MNLCSYFPQCQGCKYWDISYAEQEILKIKDLNALFLQYGSSLPEIQFLSAGEHGLRRRVDFTLQYNSDKQKHSFGFYDQNKNLLHINKCLQLSPELQQAYEEFITFDFSYSGTTIKKGSVRLRVSPDGKKGCWLDFSNIEIKELLQDQTLLRGLLSAGYIVEIGQKGKRLSIVQDQLKLTDPQPYPWFQTYGPDDDTPIPMKGLISDFTQPSWDTARLLVSTVADWLRSLPAEKSEILEFGCGLGQFTLSFLRSGYRVTACEIDQSSADNMALSAKELNLDKNLTLQVADFHKKTLSDSTKHSIAFVNPARSGLKGFTQQILECKSDYIIYVSCFPESMAEDIHKLKEFYKIEDIKIIDQFPQTRHYECAVLLQKSGI